MSTTTFPEDDLAQTTSTATVLEEAAFAPEGDIVEAQDPTWDDPRCEKCTGLLRCKEMTVCQNCGWYASLGTYVELDQDWENSAEPESSEPQPAPSHLQVWFNLLPWYAWLIIGSSAAVLVACVVVRLLLAETALLTKWSLTQLVVGTSIFGFCHIVNFLKLISDDSDTGVIDFIMKPFKIWKNVAKKLPKQLWFFDIGIVSLTAAVGALTIIGGIPYERLLDWGFEERPKANLMGAVLDQARNIKEKDMTMEEAIEELAGKAGVGDMDEEEKKPPKPEHKRNSSIDCVILGYRAHEDGTIHTLILASENFGKLRYAGRVEPELDEKENKNLLAALQAAHTPKPFLKVQLSAKWIKPLYTCRVHYAKRFKDGRLEDVAWGKMLGKIRYGKL